MRKEHLKSWQGVQHFKQHRAARPNCRETLARANAQFQTNVAKEVSPEEEKDSTC